MMNAGPLGKLRRLGAGRRRLLVRTAALLAMTSAAVALLPFRHAIRFGCVPLQPARRTSVEEIVWAVEAASRRLPWRIVCIEKGLVVQRMLRAAGFDAILHYGARHHPETGRLEAHVWVALGDRAVIGGNEAAEFAPVARYP